MVGMNLENLKQKVFEEAERIKNLPDLQSFEIKYLGRKGELISVLRSLKDFPLNERKTIGEAANKLRKEIEEAVVLKKKELAGSGEEIFIDVTRPGKKVSLGHMHPLTKMENELRRVFSSMNFSVVEGPEIEQEYYNFDALNIPASHPARDMWDTFWIKPSSKLQLPNDKRGSSSNQPLLRTHTSPIQARYMEKHKPPFQIIYRGRCFRYEATDATHEMNFYQMEGLVVGKDVSLASLKFVIGTFLEKIFGKRVLFRFRPSAYFPFTEPSVEVDMRFGNRWLEFMGAGVVHRNVLLNVGYDPRKVQGFAFGLGLERLAMIKYKIPDIRMFYSGDLRFIRQF